jgi:hemerythrin-like domain-containing protein
MDVAVHSDLFGRFTRQHNEIRLILKQIQHDLEWLSEIKDSELLADLLKKTEIIADLFLTHAKEEEGVVIPLLKQMYMEETLARYLLTEHEQLQRKVAELVGGLRILVDREEKIRGCFAEEICEWLDREMEHMFQEEQALYPLLLKYIRERKS